MAYWTEHSDIVHTARLGLCCLPGLGDKMADVGGGLARERCPYCLLQALLTYDTLSGGGGGGGG